MQAPDRRLDLRIEEASLNAWPALGQVLFDGWVVRSAHGFTRRANSVTPLAEIGYRALADRIRWCENHYARLGLPTRFRLPTCCDVQALEWALLDRGYTVEDPNLVLAAELAAGDEVPAAVRFTDRERWLATYAGLTGEPEDARRLHDLLLRGIPGDCLHALVEEDGRAVACGLGVVEDDLLGLFDVVTAREERRRGHGRALVAGLHARGRRAGAMRAYLQMRTDNAPAAALYETFGYVERYRYIYLCKA
ncbi:MAG: GNAT family N-acetyltransferase [Pseudomonadales bacterium]|nr:GNAT family N-acetyltransferase [Pseudomonadales bacterium]